jgi:hypothetical protein
VRNRQRTNTGRTETGTAQRWAEERASLASVRAEKAERKVKKLTKRTAAGTCPCCQRTFSNMAEHMKHQHPQFVADTGAKVVPIKRRIHGEG